MFNKKLKRDYERLEYAASALYEAGKWTLKVAEMAAEEQATLWEGLRDVLYKVDSTK